jgi:uncharacterized protein YndB with AHSA1/START domain
MTQDEKLQLPGDIYNVRKKVYIAARAEKVFEVITDSIHWDKYFTTGMKLEPRAGGACNFRWKNWGPDLINLESPGQVIEIEPPKLFVFRWGRPGLETTARLELEPKGEGTVLSLFEDGYPQSKTGLKNILECSAHWGELLVLIKFYIEEGITYQSPSVGYGDNQAPK